MPNRVLDTYDGKKKTKKLGADKNTNQKIQKSSIKTTTRMIRSCLTCQKRKVKCNFEIPCDRCILRNEASTCTRENVIVNGYLVNNNDTKELKFSQENEVLKSKIKELQETVLKLKAEMLSMSKETTREDNITSETVAKLTIPPLRNKNINIKAMSESSWKEYASTISLLKRGLATGVIFDNADTDLQTYDANTEEWLSLKTNKYLQMAADDIKAKCWIYELSEIEKIGKPICDLLIHNALKFSYLYNTFDKEYFLDHYEKYWSNDSEPEKHITQFYTKPASTYIFLSFMYSLMCLGLYQCTEAQLLEVNLTDENCDTLSKSFFSAALECLYRGRFLQHPHYFTLQSISIMRILACFLSGNVLSNNLLCISSFVVYKLGLEKSNNQLKKNTFWNFLQNDWYDDHDRYQLTNANNYDSFPLPEKWLDDKHKLLNWDNFYLVFSIHMSRIKSKHYFNESEITLDSLKKADVELRFVEVETFRDLESFSVKDYPNTPLEQIQIIKFHVASHCYNEILQVNSMMAAFISSREWFDMCYYTCFYCANEVVDLFLSAKYPLQMKIYAFIIEHVTSACVFLLVDCLLRNLTFRKQKKVTIKVVEVLSIFKSFKCTVTGAIRATYVINKLIQLLGKKSLFKAPETKFDNDKFSKPDQSVLITTDGNNDHMEEVESVETAINNYGSNEEENYEDDDDDDDDENDMPLYYSTIQSKSEPTIDMPQSSNTNLTDTPTTFTEAVNPTPNSQSKFNHTIMDILEDSGWSKFLTSLDDLN